LCDLSNASPIDPATVIFNLEHEFTRRVRRAEPDAPPRILPLLQALDGQLDAVIDGVADGMDERSPEPGKAPWIDARIVRLDEGPRLGLAHALRQHRCIVRKARERQCRVSLDDFGAGMSSFEYLRRFPVDQIKIDGSFIENIAQSRFDREIVSAITGIAKSLGCAVVAEKIEEQAALDILRNMGVAYGQGFLLHRPEPLEAIVARASAEAPRKRFG